MYELEIAVTKVLGTCTAGPPMQPGDCFFVRDGDIRIPEGGYICMWALQSLLPVITPKEREIVEHEDEDWMWRVHHVQCPDPEGRVIFRINRTGKVVKQAAECNRSSLNAEACCEMAAQSSEGELRSLRVVVKEVRGKCTSGLEPGDDFCLRSGRLYIPAQRHFCLYALHAVLPMLPARQRQLQDGDWLKNADLVICPDPAGNVILEIQEC